MVSNTTTDIKPWLVLSRVSGFGPSKFKNLITHFGNAQNILDASSAELTSFGLKQNIIKALHNPDLDNIEADIIWSALPNHHIIAFDNDLYPRQLRTISDPPCLLYVWGDPDYLNQPQLAMVGSRTPTASGKKTAFEFSQHLSRAGVTITSGLARGIDGASHKGALEGIAGTIALVAHGLDIIYPAEHRDLAESISRNGAIVSEMPIGTTPHRGLFPRRNRLISGISQGTLVVEAALKSGSLITAKLALEQGREVFAIPGSIHNPLARGCHQLIRQGAKLVETANDILEELLPNLAIEKIDPSIDDNSAEQYEILDPDHQKLLKCLAYETMSIDDLVAQSNFSAAEIASMLLILELEGHVVCQNGLFAQVR